MFQVSPGQGRASRRGVLCVCAFDQFYRLLLGEVEPGPSQRPHDPALTPRSGHAARAYRRRDVEAIPRRLHRQPSAGAPGAAPRHVLRRHSEPAGAAL